MTKRSTTGEVSDATVERACVVPTRCLCMEGNCHCGDYMLILDGQRLADGDAEDMQAIADAINAPMRAALEAAALPVAAHLDEQRPFPLPKPFKRAPVAAPMGGDAVRKLPAMWRQRTEYRDIRHESPLAADCIEYCANELETALAATPAPPPAMQAEIDRLRADAERYQKFCHQAEMGTFHPALLEDALHMGPGVLDMHFDDCTLDAARARDAGEVEG